MSMNLCELCIRQYSECMNKHENLPKITYGNDGIHTDAVIECDWYIARPKAETK